MEKAIERLSYTLDEACQATGMNRSAIYRAIEVNSIGTFKIGKRRMVSARALREFIERKEREASAAGVAA